jgi:putative ABC transport system permease protein
MGAAVATALMAVSMDIEDQVSNEFRKYGANLIIVPHSDTIDVGFPGVDFTTVTEQRYINETDIWKIKRISWRQNVLGFAPFLYQVVSASSASATSNLVLAGTYFEKDVYIEDKYDPDDEDVVTTGVSYINAWWKSSGAWIDAEDDEVSAMVGVEVAKKLNVDMGDTLNLTYIPNGADQVNATSYDVTVVGIVETGGNEDSQVFVNLHLAQNMTGREDKVHTVQVSALCTGCPVNVFAREIEGEMEYVEARTVKQLVSAEMATLQNFKGMMAMVTVVAMAASTLGVTTTMTTSVIERRKEIGLMKALGAERRRITTLFLVESSIIGVIGGIIGFTVGVFLARMIGLSVFDTAVATNLLLLPVAIAISVAVAVLASIPPVRRALKVEPAIVLRGE